jgi:hypothetical protein
MIVDHPFVGVGVGGAQTLMRPYARATLGTDLPPDNAQNWYRHQFAELGLLGSPGWILWVLLAFAALISGRTPADRPDIGVIRWILIAFGLISTVSMPGQDPSVVFVFWGLMFWWFQSTPSTSKPPGARSVTAWPAVWLLALCHAAVTLNAAFGELRPPTRAARFGFPYTYGLAVNSPGLALVSGSGVGVLEAETEWLRIRVWVDDARSFGDRTHADVWVGDAHVINQRLGRERVERYVRVAAGQRFVLRARVDSARSKPGARQPDPAGAVGLSWEFVAGPPP